MYYPRSFVAKARKIVKFFSQSSRNRSKDQTCNLHSNVALVLPTDRDFPSKYLLSSSHFCCVSNVSFDVFQTPIRFSASTVQTEYQWQESASSSYTGRRLRSPFMTTHSKDPHSPGIKEALTSLTRLVRS